MRSQACLSFLPLLSLKQLNLDKNGISKVPYLHQKENSRFFLSPDVAKMGTRAEAGSRLRQWHKRRQRGGADGHKEPKEKGGQQEYFILQNSKDLDRTGEQLCFAFAPSGPSPSSCRNHRQVSWGGKIRPFHPLLGLSGAPHCASVGTATCGRIQTAYAQQHWSKLGLGIPWGKGGQDQPR